MKKSVLLLSLSLMSLSGIAQNVNIPDANFKAYLLGHGGINTNSDSEIQLSEAQAFTGQINCNNLSISDLTGIEAFTAITGLSCRSNQLTSLNISANTAITFLYCDDNQLTSLDVSTNTALTQLWCHMNQLTSIDISSNLALDEFWCYSNQLTSLDVTANTALFYVLCFDNQISSLNFSANPALNELRCDGNQLSSLNVKNGNNTNFYGLTAHNNPNLTCIEVDNAAYSTANWTGTNFQFDAQHTFSEDCASLSLVSHFSANDIILYPNPTKELLNLELGESSQIEVFNVLGELVLRTDLATGNSTIDVGFVPSGVYFIQFTHEKGNTTQTKFIIE